MIVNEVSPSLRTALFQAPERPNGARLVDGDGPGGVRYSAALYREHVFLRGQGGQLDSEPEAVLWRPRH